MKKKQDIFDLELDPEEQALLKSLEHDEWESVENLAEEKIFAKEAAANFSRKMCGSLTAIKTK